MTLRKELEGTLSEKELRLIPSSFDILGNKQKAVAIIDIHEKLEGKKKKIAEALMRKHKNVKSVLKKMSERKGIFRNRDYELLAGDDDTEVMHIESGCRFLVDPQTCYFSQREGTERLRIAEKVRKGEVVMVFFSGAGPFPTIISKKSKAKRIVGIEINDKAVYYARENVKLNKINNVETIFGDVHNEAQRFYNKCDRVIMPLPEKSIEYMEEAVKCLKSKGVINFYCFVDEKEMSGKKEGIVRLIKNIGFYSRITESRKVLPYGPRIWKMRF
ncbi:MAG: 50S ribosomal protein L11 methyltransferase, partial [Candidatus Aenigmarchaeota archaeon]|nr:50S ribosomal protein L11 methyltransferase [Candidatus Aenigmarchaeota archaeon]